MPKSSPRDAGIVIPGNEEGAPSHPAPADASSSRWSGSRLGESHVAYLDLAEEVERRREAGAAFLPVYRIYLRNKAGAVMAGYTVAIESDAEAMRVAAILCHAGNDASAKFEIWKGEVMLAFNGSNTKPATRLSQQFQLGAMDDRLVGDQPACPRRRAQ